MDEEGGESAGGRHGYRRNGKSAGGRHGYRRNGKQGNTMMMRRVGRVPGVGMATGGTGDAQQGNTMKILDYTD